MPPEDSAFEIRRRMAQLRRDLTLDVRDFAHDARVMTSWKFYVRRFPWAAAALAAAAGYCAVPKRRESTSNEAKLFAQIAATNAPSVSGSGANEKRGMVQSLAIAGLAWAAKSGARFLAEQIRHAATQAASANADGRTRPQSTKSECSNR